MSLVLATTTFFRIRDCRGSNLCHWRWCIILEEGPPLGDHLWETLTHLDSEGDDDSGRIALGDRLVIILVPFAFHLAPFLHFVTPFWHPRAQTWSRTNKHGTPVPPKGVFLRRGCALCPQMGSKMGTDFA